MDGPLNSLLRYNSSVFQQGPKDSPGLSLKSSGDMGQSSGDGENDGKPGHDWHSTAYGMLSVSLPVHVVSDVIDFTLHTDH